ncbi:glycosyl transferase family 1 [Flavobacterium sp. Root935]|jgi:glycosyltransferase involved in cell wall biosynthesis|uniref:glycosyltransferase n=1 Tax=unclassified Flavobacterium TaxID=196869 RepID=UPI00070CDA64|nr:MULTISPECIES: glycosyltransferase [unclassified Flavobacterium]KRD61218.1 glycosyl transferase family 1 [Flavobacterium sp. Root935]MDQ1166324.1 glycosyltransferase involved in cell wall biosynthesis [Flavobacterium sp. SORGH_AS_0622]TDX09700.1 glycosyltransferase involved in cell wall biosynthesis [Flavobacterium sp. S87F.05.LMB.W.Kidney.N]
MKTISNKSKIVFLSTFPPTQCGIATYTQDTIKGITDVYGKSITCEICELVDTPKEKPTQAFTLNTKNREEYAKVAEEINQDGAVKLVHIQHEFGLFSGNYGDHLLDFLNVIKVPVTYTFHSVIPNPNNELKTFVKLLLSYSNSVFVMTNKSKEILIKDYDINEEIITCVPHGTHIVVYEAPQNAKEKLNIGDRIVLSTFGLLGEGKNIETGLQALPKIVEKAPNALYLIIGKTHPNLIKDGVDTYREKLESIVEELNLQNNVRFINKYLDTDELLEYLKATDIYMFTSKDPNQAVSGTFAYAMSCACPIVASKIPHTKEVLTPDSGILVDIGDVDQFADAAIKLIADENLRNEMGINSFTKMRASSWENAAITHMNTYKNLMENSSEIKYSYPEIQLRHIKRLTTELGIIQFSKISIPDLDSGYTLDDNARALIAFCMHYKLTQDKDDLAYILIYLDFIQRCQKPKGDFINYVDQENREHVEQNAEVNLEDSNARAIWALGTVVSLSDILPEAITKKATRCLLNSLKWTETIQSPRSIGFATKGLYLYHSTIPNLYVAAIINKLNAKLLKNYEDTATEDWKWFENYLTYGNGVLPESMLYAYLITNKPIYKKVALDSLDFLISKTFVNGDFKAISNRSWHHKGSEPQQYGEQPIDVTYTIQTLNAFYDAFKTPEYKKKMRIAFNWFLGKNHLNQIMYNPVSGGGYDGLEKENVNLNQGAESTVCFLTARLLMEKLAQTQSKVIPLMKSRTGIAINS